MPIVPDDKNWTWVLDRPCPECGFGAADVDLAMLGDLIRANAAAWPALLARPAARQRPFDHQWSALEYGCHVRDVFRLYLFRLGLMLERDDPTYPNWDQDAAAIDDRYPDQDPELVAEQLLAAAEALAAAFDAVAPDQWQRTGTRSDGAVFTIETFSRYLLHDPVHHLHDVASGYAAIG